MIILMFFLFNLNNCWPDDKKDYLQYSIIKYSVYICALILLIL